MSKEPNNMSNKALRTLNSYILLSVHLNEVKTFLRIGQTWKILKLSMQSFPLLDNNILNLPKMAQEFDKDKKITLI